jgi:hypothetical protein
MSTRAALRLTIDTERLKPTDAIRPMAERGIPCVLTNRMLRDLERELGTMAAAITWLVDLATFTSRPMAVNVETAEGSTTVLLAPRGWGDERLKGWAGGLAEGLERHFGAASIREWGDGGRAGKRAQPRTTGG